MILTWSFTTQIVPKLDLHILLMNLDLANLGQEIIDTALCF